jgi:hypothetical protein
MIVASVAGARIAKFRGRLIREEMKSLMAIII